MPQDSDLCFLLRLLAQFALPAGVAPAPLGIDGGSGTTSTGGSESGVDMEGVSHPWTGALSVRKMNCQFTLHFLSN